MLNLVYINIFNFLYKIKKRILYLTLDNKYENIKFELERIENHIAKNKKNIINKENKKKHNI